MAACFRISIWLYRFIYCYDWKISGSRPLGKKKKKPNQCHILRMVEVSWHCKSVLVFPSVNRISFDQLCLNFGPIFKSDSNPNAVYILGNPADDNTETQLADVMVAPAPPDPIAPVISPPVSSEELRDKYQNQKPKEHEDPDTFVYDPENPKTPPRKTRRKSKEKKPDSSDEFTQTVKKADDDKAGLGSNGSICVGWKIHMLCKVLTNNVFETLTFEDHLQSAYIQQSKKHVSQNQTIDS